MARYSTFKYGAAKYGTDPETSLYLWGITVAWDGSFVWGNEALRCRDLRVRRGRDTYVGQSGFEPHAIGEAIAILDNEDGRYDPYNASSPIYGYIEPGKTAKIFVKNGNTGTQYGVVEGVVWDIQPMLIDNKKHTRLVIRDGLQWLQNERVLVGELESQSIETILNYILDDVSSPWSLSIASSTLTTDTDIQYWWTWQRPALEDLRELAKSYGAVCFHGRDGVIYWMNIDCTHNRTKAVDETDILRDIAYEYPWREIFNKIDVEYWTKTILNVDTALSPNTLAFVLYGSWQYTPIANGETLSFDATFQYQGTDRLAGYNETVSVIVYDADLIDEITGSCTITYEDPVGGGTRIYITNNAGEAGKVTSVSVDGDVLTGLSASARSTSDTTSVAQYGPRTATFGGFWMDNPLYADTVAAHLLANLKDVHPVITIQFENNPDFQFYLDLYDQVDLTLPTFSVDDNYRVGSIEHQWQSQNGQSVLTTMRLEPYFVYSA